MVLCIGIILLILFINRFTTVNLNFTTNSKNIPDLSQPIENDFCSIKRVTKGDWNEIRYDPKNDFYNIACKTKIKHIVWTKFQMLQFLPNTTTTILNCMTLKISVLKTEY